MRDPVWTEFGRWLREVRERSSLSLEQVNDQSKGYGKRVTKSYLSRAELGEYLPDLDRLQTLGQLYGISLPDMTAHYEALKLHLDSSARPKDRLKDYDALIRQAGERVFAGEHSEALAMYERAHRISKRVPKEPEKELDALMGIGSCLNHLGRFKQARGIAETLIARAAGHPRILSSGIHLLANTYISEQRNEIAEALILGFRKTLNAGPRKARGRVFLTLSHLYTVMHRPGDAAKAAQRALEDFHEGDEEVAPAEIAQAQYIYGQALSGLGKFNLALRELSRARELYRQAGAERKVALTYLESGGTYFLAQNFLAARRYLTRGVRIARECGALDLLLAGYTHLWQLESRLENRERALSHRRMARKLRRRVPKELPLFRGFAHLLDAMEKAD